ncbi:MAG: hypothetical protein J5I52_07395 [Saprospiraceae bacterium]|nr:MAG: hypothetical protein UZ09_BCD002001227 [Bacteroidetes bacterium OLB9]MCO6463957.1 hypothetical protein [Saprospiraceae bacterium]MCZ2337350.1 hypothetical protein [Chitinophagales bacterium]
MIRRSLIILTFIVGLLSCDYKSKPDNDLDMTNDEIVHALVELYTVNAANGINDPAVRDSMRMVYLKQVELVTGKPIDVIMSDLHKLNKMPDTLLKLQRRALDTIIQLYEDYDNLPYEGIK